MTNKFYSVLTTIQEPTAAVATLVGRVADHSGHLVVAGDAKGPDRFETGGPVTFLSIQDQIDGPFSLARALPTGHYCRKNIAYLHAIAQGAGCIYETDDDNAPLPSWTVRDEYLGTARVISKPEFASRWVNVYRHFSDENIWPRGLPLDVIRAPLPDAPDHFGEPIWAPIQQGLANGSPDVDAIWRLVLDREFTFDERTSVYLSPGNWCPFNTQTTWWWPVAYPLLYIPSYCSFRMCDIWKSFIAQRCLWELGAGVAFHASEVVQDRNIHDLMQDFADELPGYCQNHQLIKVLENVRLSSDPGKVTENLRLCYEALVSDGIFPEKELLLVDSWLSALRGGDEAV